MNLTILCPSDSWYIESAASLGMEFRSLGHRVEWACSLEDLPERAPAHCMFIMSFDQIVPKELLQRNAHNVVVHSSALPEGRGWSPLSWQVLEGRRTITNTLFEARETVDAGPIYSSNTFELDGTELLPELHEKQAESIRLLCLQFIARDLWEEKVSGVGICGRQMEGKGSSYRRRTPEDSRLDPGKTIADQFNLLRIVDNERYPSFFEHLGERYVLRITKAERDR